MVREFEIFEHTSDTGIRAYGTDLKQLYANAAKGLFSLIIEPESVRRWQRHRVVVTAENREMLLVAWLNELIFLFDTEHWLFKRFEIIELSETHLKAMAYGETANKSRHVLKTAVKSATYHMLKIDFDGGYRAQVIIDI